MDITNFKPEAYVDLFGTGKVDDKSDSPKFQSLPDNNVDILGSTTETTTSSLTETTTLNPSTTETTTIQPDVDILGEVKKPGRKPKYDFEDTSGYFADRIKNGKFVAIEEEDEEGNKKTFIPRTPEEFDEVLDIQINYRIEQEKKKIEESWIKSKSPAWQAVARYADLVDDPTEILPFVQGIKSFDTVSNLNEAELDDAEKIVRIRLAQKGDPENIIEEQIEALKTTDRLVSTAKSYKPIILQEEQRSLQQMMAHKYAEEQQQLQIVQEIEEKTRKTLDNPLLGKIKLRQEEKASVYELIGIPSEQTEGYQIYSEIDKLYDNRDFATLTQLALLLKHKDSFFNYISAQAVETNAANVQKKLRVATDSSKAKADDYFEETDENQVRVKRNQYTTRFGR